jgi:flavonol synthase
VTFQIPVIDLTAAREGRLSETELDAIRYSAENVGILQLVNHGVPDELIADYGQRIDRVLSLPRARKAELASPDGNPYRGWRQWPDDFGRLELERYNTAQFDTPQDAADAGVPSQYTRLFASPNVWPADDPQLRPAARRYIEASAAVAQDVLNLYAQILGLPAGALSLGALPHLRMTTNNYPTWTYPEAASDEDKLLLLEHADDSMLTVLTQEGDYPGLQVQVPDGSWLPVPVRPGALQAFSGQLLTRRTGGRLRAVRHRVVAGGTMTRRSTAVFCHPSLETVVEPLPQFADGSAAQGPLSPRAASRRQNAEADAEPVLIFDHVAGRVEDYLRRYGRPDQIAAWREGRPYVAELAEDSAGR